MKWGKLLKEAMLKMGRRIPYVTEYRKWIEDAGFVDVNERITKRASNDWPKDKKMKEIGKVGLPFFGHVFPISICGLKN